MVSTGPEKWKESTIDNIKVAQTLIVRAEKAKDEAKVSVPMPSLRDSCVRESNQRIHAYARSTRDVVIRLKQVLAATNEQIKSVNRVRQLLEKSLDNCRKDIILNCQCNDIRKYRPQREKSISDGADELLTSEQSQLFQQKITLESWLAKVHKNLQVLNSARANLSSVIHERSRVTDLLCHSISSSSNTTRPPVKLHWKAYSAPSVLLSDNLSDVKNCGPLDPLTPAAVTAIQNAEEICQKSCQLKSECLAAVDETRQQHQSMHNLVNHSLIQKVAETVTLSQHLQVNNGETKLTEQKSIYHLAQQEKSLGYLMGPISSCDITKREKLDRPLVKVYQRHPGTDLPEASQLIQATNITMDSIAQTQRNISLLKLARKKLKEDIRDKQIALEIDSNIVRLRRRKSDYRWVVQGNGCIMRLPRATLPSKA